MATELINAIKQIAEEKDLSVDSIKETVELALAAAFRKDFGNKQQNLKVDFDLETGNSKIFDIKTVVPDELFEKYETEQAAKEKERAERESGGTTDMVEKKETEKISEPQEEDEETRFSPKTMISLSAARQIKKTAKLDEELSQELEVPTDYGRMAAQTAKQVIIQKIREAERENIYQTFKEKEHELITGMIQRLEAKVILVDVDRTTTIMPVSEQIPRENYRIGNRFKFYIKEVKLSQRGPEIVVSRAHPELIRKLFIVEVPEINSGAVVIRSIAREAGERSKVAVVAKEENVDPIGACVGQRGTRVQTVINELGGEKIDIIEFEEDTPSFVANSLSPAKVLRVEIDEENRLARAFVKNDQLSLAIGKGGQNVRLAAKLTSWRIDIVDESSGQVKESTIQENQAEGAADAAIDSGTDTPGPETSNADTKTEPTDEKSVDTNDSKTTAQINDTNVAS